MPYRSLGERNYAPFANRYAQMIETKPHNAYYERPATLSLLPPVHSRRILDGGCGPGIYTLELLARGAEVVACDVTPAFVEMTRQRVGHRAEVHLANLEEPIAFAGDGDFDGVLMSLVLDYIGDLDALYAEVWRILKPGGWFLFSCGHPLADLSEDSDYFQPEVVEQTWTGFGDEPVTIHAYRRSLGGLLNPLVGAGLMIDRILEPQPTPEFADYEPELYTQLLREPGFIVMRAHKASSTYPRMG